jgi:hypothetical protein
LAEGELPIRNPIRGILPGCCASAGTQSARSIAQSRIANLKLRGADFRLISRHSIKIVVPPNPKFEIHNRKLLDDLVRSR